MLFDITYQKLYSLVQLCESCSGESQGSVMQDLILVLTTYLTSNRFVITVHCNYEKPITV